MSSDSMAADRFTSSYDGSKSLSNGQYIGGGVASIFLGAGIGHAIQGRWMEKGWIFTVGGLVTGIGYVASSTLFAVKSYETKTLDKGTGGVALAFLLAHLGLRVWELIDVWMLPSNYTVVKESPFQIKPLAFYDQENLNLGLSLNYTF